MKELLLYENALSLLSGRAFSYITNEFIVAYLLIYLIGIHLIRPFSGI